MFTDSLEMALTLSVEKKTFIVPGGNIKALKLDHKSYGFKCLLSFWVSNESWTDLLFPFFLKGVANNANLNQSDGIHPNEEGMKIVTENVWGPFLKLINKNHDSS